MTIPILNNQYVALSEFEHKLLEFWGMPESREEPEEDENELCEELYQRKVTRDNEGRYMVPTP